MLLEHVSPSSPSATITTSPHRHNLTPGVVTSIHNKGCIGFCIRKVKLAVDQPWWRSLQLSSAASIILQISRWFVCVCGVIVATYPGLLAPAFVACSTNAGEGLVKLSHMV